MPKLSPRDVSGAAGAAGSASGISLGVIIAVVVLGTVFLAVGGGLLCAWIARRKRRQRRQSRRQLQEENRNKQMSTVSMMLDSNEQVQTAATGTNTGTVAAATDAHCSHLSGQSILDCSSSTCCSLASTRDSLSTLDANFEGSGATWWWLRRWRRFWHNQRRWIRRQRQRSAVVLGRKGSSSSSSDQGNEIKQQSQHDRCQHDHGHNGHHHHRRGAADGSPRKLQRYRPKTSIIASTNSLFDSAFLGESDNNANAISNHAAGGERSLRAPPPTFTIIRTASLPHRPPPPSEQQRLLPPRNPSNRLPNSDFHGSNQSLMPNVPPRQYSSRYRPQQKQQNQQSQPIQMMQQGPSLQMAPPNTARNMPRPPLPALLIPNQSQSRIAPGVPFHPSVPQSQQHQMMMMIIHQKQQQQQQQQQMQLQQQFQLQQQRQQRRLSGPGSSQFQTLSTDTALSEILQSTEQRLAQLQCQPSSRGSLKHLSMSSPTKVAVGAPASSESAPPADMEGDYVKRSSQTSGSDADSMVKGGGEDGRDTSPIVDAIPTALSSPSKSPNKNRVAAGTLAAAGSNVLAHPLVSAAPSVLQPQPALANTSSSSPGTRSPSSVYSSSGASSRSSLSTVYSVDERSEKGAVATKATPKSGVQIANNDDDVHSDAILAGLGITGSTADDQFAEVAKKPEDFQLTLAATPLATPKSRASRGMSTSTAAAPNLPTRSPKRSNEPGSSMPRGSGIMISHSSSASNSGDVFYSEMCHGNINAVPGNNGHNAASPNRSRHRRNASLSQQQIQQLSLLTNNGNVRLSFSGGSMHESAGSRPNLGPYSTTPAVRVLVTSPSKPDMNSKNRSSHMHIDPADLSDEKTPTSDSSMTEWCGPDKTTSRGAHSLVPGQANPRTSWGTGKSAPHPPKHGRRSLNERVEALQAVQSDEAQFRDLVRPLPRPPSFGSLNNLNNFNALQQNSKTNNLTVVAAAAELRRMNSTAYSESSSCYSNATSTTSHAVNNTQQIFISTAPSAMGLPQTRRAGRRRNSSAGESASSAAQRNSVVGSRQYLALGKQCVSQVPATYSSYNKENSDKANKRSSAPPASSRPTPQRSRSTKSMLTTGTALRRVDENPASGLSTPVNGTPSKGTPGGTPSKALASAGAASPARSAAVNGSTPKANTGKPLRKSPSRSAQVGYIAGTGSPVAKLRPKSMVSPGTPTRNSAGGLRQPTNRDSLGLYDEDGFLLSSPARK
ncbi:hypothetical protein SEPCBS119000_000570 [Sporothrix epigloea]|uniref:Uncharacterized protein n=1 Tax=Sporothrix epigloea TaxID=1892477 RepID=A0ABP0D5W3_9PEZI